MVPADKQQKGSFYISDYGVQLVTNLRKDSRKTSCFEFFAPGRRPFQVRLINKRLFEYKTISKRYFPCDRNGSSFNPDSKISGFFFYWVQRSSDFPKDLDVLMLNANNANGNVVFLLTSSPPAVLRKPRNGWIRSK